MMRVKRELEYVEEKYSAYLVELNRADDLTAKEKKQKNIEAILRIESYLSRSENPYCPKVLKGIHAITNEMLSNASERDTIRKNHESEKMQIEQLKKALKKRDQEA